jgi:hypothetical protein
MEEFLYSPGEIIFKSGELDDCSIFYLYKGEVRLFLDNKIPLKVIEKN